MEAFVWFTMAGMFLAACAVLVGWYGSDGEVKRRQQRRLQDERIQTALRLLAGDQLD